MAKEFAIVEANGGYIIKAIDTSVGTEPGLLVKPNFGAVIKAARVFFNETKTAAQGDNQE